jgi:hypothetical protein
MKSLTIAVSVCIAVGLFCTGAYAQTFQDRLISSTFKTLAKAYINTADLNALKNNTIASLQPLDNESFHKRYPYTLQVIDDSPVLTKQYGLRSDMSARQAISFIRPLDKKKIAAVIDAVPDGVVAHHVREYLSQKAAPLKTKSIVDQVKVVWGDIQKRLDKTALKP